MIVGFMFLPSKELSTIITLTFPIGLPVPGSPIFLFLTLVFVGDDKHDAHYNDYYSHIFVFVFYGIFSFFNCSVMNFSNIVGQNTSPYRSTYITSAGAGLWYVCPCFHLLLFFARLSHVGLFSRLSSTGGGTSMCICRNRW